jgi:hypothetical protein
VKAKRILGALGVLGIGALIFGGRKSRASPKGSTSKPPSNVSFVDGKLDALGAGARLAASQGPFVVVATDQSHRSVVVDVVTKRARANPQFQYIVVDMDLARGLAADEGVALPENVWGGVASVLDGELIRHAYFATTDTVDVAAEVIDEVEGTVPSLGSTAIEAPPVTAGILPPPRGS